MSTFVTVTNLSFIWPNGGQVFGGLDAVFSDGRTALIGDNGTGKSTLLRLIHRQLQAQSGNIKVSGQVAYLPQELPLRLGDTVAELLGISDRLRALEAIESGDVDEAHFAVIGEDWDFAERARVTLDELGLDHVEFDRTVATLSGGESMLVGLAGRLLLRPDVLLLDEPSNNLDASARERLYQAIRRFKGTLLVVSHDRALLGHVDAIAELYAGKIRTFAGNFDDYERAIAIEQEAAAQAIRDAKADVAKQKRELIAARIKGDRGASNWRKERLKGGTPKMVMNAKKNAGEVSSAKYLIAKQDDVAEARERLDAAEAEFRDDASIEVDLPETEVSVHREIAVLRGVQAADLYGDGLDLHLRGPERVGLLGDNGSGKTTLLRILAESSRVPHGFLTQRLELLDGDASVLDNVRSRADETDQSLLRTRLARFGLRGNAVFNQVSTLSGGERLRVALATVLAARPAPLLLMLDEPTNNLDMTSTHQLQQALIAYKGALVVVSHDEAFLDGLGLTRRIRLERGSGIVADTVGDLP